MSNVLDQWRVAIANAQNTVDGEAREIVPASAFDQRIHAALYAAAMMNVGGITIYQREGRCAGVAWRYQNSTLAVPVLLDPTPKFMRLYQRWLRLVLECATWGGDLAQVLRERAQARMLRALPADLTTAERDLFTAWALGMGYAYLPHRAAATMCMASRGRDWWGNQL